MIRIISKNPLSAIPTTHHMVNGSLVLNSGFPWHALDIHARDSPVNTRIRGLTPYALMPPYASALIVSSRRDHGERSVYTLYLCA